MEVAAAGQAIGLCVLTGLFFEWLVAAAQRLLAAGGWGLLPDEVPGAGGPVAALLLGLRGARERRSGQAERSAELLDAALGEPGLPGTLRRFLLLHRAHALRVAGRYADGAADYTVLWREPGEFRLDAGYWLADYGFLQGRFGAALADLDQIDGAADVPAELRGEILRLRGHIYRVNALFDRAEAAYRAALELARGTANLAAEGKALTDLMQTLAWRRPADAREIGPRAVEVNEALRNQVEIVKIRAADAVALAGLGESGEAGAEIERGLALTRDCGYPGGQVWCQVARAYSQLRQGEPGAARETAARVAAITAGLGGNRFWAEITAWQTAAGPGQPPPEGTADWLDGADAARARWLAVLPEDENHGT
jgi:tetratricopeptide (TPR) repeat protein